MYIITPCMLRKWSPIPSPILSPLIPYRIRAQRCSCHTIPACNFRWSYYTKDGTALGDTMQGLRHTPNLTTEAGISAKSRQTRQDARPQACFGHNRSLWDRRSLAAYSWTRTYKGPFNPWLHRIGKAVSSRCSDPYSNTAHSVMSRPIDQWAAIARWVGLFTNRANDRPIQEWASHHSNILFTGNPI